MFVNVARLVWKEKARPYTLFCLMIVSYCVCVVCGSLFVRRASRYTDGRCSSVLLDVNPHVHDVDSIVYVSTVHLCSDVHDPHSHVLLIYPLSVFVSGIIGIILIFGCDKKVEQTVVQWDPLKVQKKMISVRRLTTKQVTESLSAAHKRKNDVPLQGHGDDYELRSHSLTSISSDNEEEHISIVQSAMFPNYKSSMPLKCDYGNPELTKSLIEPQSAVKQSILNPPALDASDSNISSMVQPLQVKDIILSRCSFFFLIS